MSGPAFRIWFGDRAATTEELARIEEIEVTQEMDAFWEAHLRIVLCLDGSGAWLHWPGDTAAPFSRVRIEVDNGAGFVALIDGPLVAIDAALDAQPGRSTAAMVVRDDSAFMNRDEAAEPVFENRRASSLAEEIFGRFAQIAATRIAATDAVPETTTRRGTALQFLRALGRASDRHAYVLPGEMRGQSTGCFLPDPAAAADLPPLVLIGDARSLSNASIVQDPDGGERTSAAVLRVDDQGITSVESSAADLGLMRGLPALPADLTPRRLVDPVDNTRADPEAAARAQARRRGYVYRLSAHVVPGCYTAILSPYRKVRIDAARTPYSGDYLITKVIHRITPSLYDQQFEAKADGQTEVSGAAVAEALGGGLGPSVSASVSIF